MSLDASRWAWKQDLRPAALKLVLLSLADRADAKHQAFPSAKCLALDTGLDVKTVVKTVKRLQENGVIEDTGMRRGRTKSVKVWQLLGVVGRHDEESAVEITHTVNARNQATPKTDDLSSPKNGDPSCTKNGLAKLTQKRGTEPTSNNLSVEPPPLSPQPKKEKEEGVSELKDAPTMMPDDFPQQVQALYNRVIESQSKKGGLEYPNACEWNTLRMEQCLAIKRLYLDRELTDLGEWQEYFEALLSSKFGRSMDAITVRFLLKDETVCNCMDGVYAKTELNR